MASNPETAGDGAARHVFPSRKAVVDRLFRRAFGVYLVFAFVLTGLLVADVVVGARDQVRQELAGHELVFRPAMARTLWDMDLAQLETLARGALDVPVVDAVRIRDPASGRMFVDLRKHPPSSEGDERYVVHRFPIRFGQGAQGTLVGEAEFASSERAIFARVQRPIALLVTLAVAKTVAMWLIFGWFARRLVRNPLAELTQAAVSAAPEAVHPIDMKPGTRRAVEGTEFEALRDAFNALIERIEANRRRFAALNERLETEVALRTRELQAANERLGALAATDALTLLTNRRGFESFAAIVLAQVARNKGQVSLVAIDIDRFKAVNDTHGHGAGDRVLQGLAQAMRSVSRAADIAARVGGDEFVLMLPMTGAEEAAEVARRVLGEFSSRPTLLANGVEIHATASAGMATADNETTLAALLSMADAALYEAKRAGRNQLRSAGAGPHLRLA